MSRITVNLQHETKERVTNLTAKYNRKNLSDGLDCLLDDYQAALRKIDNLQIEYTDYRNMIEANTVHVGEDSKTALLQLAKDFSLQKESDVIDMLLDVYYSSKSIDRTVFDKWMLRRTV